MNPTNKSILDTNRFHHTNIVQNGFMRGLDGHTRNELQRIIQEEFQPGYSADLSCPHCVAEMIKTAYRHYDNWLASQPIIVAANFPSNKEENY